MSAAVLDFVAKKMEEIGVPYMFGNWNDELPEDKGYYCIADGYIEPPSPYKTENGKTDATLYLRLYTWKDVLVLEQAKELIEKTFALTAILDNGSAVAIFCDGALVTPTGDNAWMAMKIDLNIQEWRAN